MHEHLPVPPSGPAARPARRNFLRAGPLLAASLAVPALPARAQSGAGERWSATWGAAPAGPPPSASTQSYTSQTLRLVVHTSIGGNRVRVRFSNEMGSTPLRIGAASIGVRSSSSAVSQSTLRTLSFGGQSAITVPAGAPALSDPVELAVPAQADLAISLYLPGTVQATTLHDMALTSSYVSPAGDYTSSVSMPVSRSITSWPFLTEVDVDGAASTLIAIGDSLTDGARSTGNVNRRWPDYLVRRLQSSLGAGGRIGVVNRGISANLLLNDYATALVAGRDVLERFDRDVLATAGVRYLAVLIGINDISYSSGSNPIPAADLIAGYRQVIARAHAHGITVIGATLPPMEGFVYYTAAREAVRRAANSWIRFSGEFDAVADIEAALRDPNDPAHILPLYDSGDHLHPNDAGYQAMANAFPLAPFVAATTPPLDFLNRY
ncbi:SGNH/GDSL hydrolase family protein [Massilia sp. YIM B02769]|uniref:SGNH/GDSL hydrolase family protein n=1 Tax=Massilia sp. YIM B02769 TaxID=3050129 RepID=UPI0025B65F92|nr:SGNH/GDSL hydrolase family protein [Massilia sp. YIM B02769]MDN4060909.1 SGNH/GDSL hydrolase family protein [Massilia sp. YIM B02769]